MEDTNETAAQRLDRLADEMLAGQLAWSPLYASQVGYPEHIAAVPDLSAEGAQRRERALEDLRGRVAQVDEGALDTERRITLQILRRKLSDELLAIRARPEEYTVTPDPFSGVAAQVINTVPKTQVRTAEDAEAYLERCTRIPGWLAESGRRLAEGRATGRTPVRRLVAIAIDQIEGYLLAPPEADPLLLAPESAPPGWHDRLAAVLRDQVRPALARYAEDLRAEVLPGARPASHPGLVHLPGGAELYQQLAAEHTTTDYSPDELHQMGLELVERLTEEMRDRAAPVLGTSDFAEITGRLRSDPALYFDTSDEVLQAASKALARAQAELPRWLGVLPRVGCQVLPMGPHEVESGTIAYYQWPSVDGDRPGTYWVNTYKPEARPRFEAETLAFHESVPGHHTQLALAYELPGLCDFRRHADVTAFIEGWGLYTERLADEMGLYTDDLSRLGMVSFDFWRACRLVVDTGMHARGWSRDQAVTYMTEHSALTPENIANEVDRYISWPGQALGYMVGRLEIQRLRADAEGRLGSRFSLRDFHSTVLGHGNLPLSVLGEVVTGWAEQGGGPPESR